MGIEKDCSLEKHYPELASEWHGPKNVPQKVSDIDCKSGKTHWWICDKNHEWRAVVKKRVLGFSKCLPCLREQGLDLLDAYPQLAPEFDERKNTVSDFPLGFGNKKYWWLCLRGHSYEATASSRAKGSSCPYCTNQKILAGFNDMATTHPELAKYLDAEKTGLSASEVSAGSGKKYWWLCSKGHSTFATPDKRKKKPSACPVCQNKEIIKGVNDMATTHPKLASEFDLEKNHPLTPESISAGTHKVLWWICPKNHSYDVDGSHRLTQNSGCPICTSQRILTGFNDMATLAPQLIPHFNYERNFPRTPENLAYSSNLKLWWICEIGHEYQAKAGNRLQEGGLGCPVCSTHQILAGFNDMATTHPELAKEWHPDKNDFGPHQVAAGTNKKAWWKCSEGHEWKAWINLRSRGRNCPRCSKGGFDNTLPGWFYLIENQDLQAGKVGISNHETKRLEEYLEGWTLLRVWSDESGSKIRDLETVILRHIRLGLGLPQYLSSTEMGHAGGASETFSLNGLDMSQLIRKIDSSLKILSE